MSKSTNNLIEFYFQQSGLKESTSKIRIQDPHSKKDRKENKIKRTINKHYIDARTQKQKKLDVVSGVAVPVARRPVGSSNITTGLARFFTRYWSLRKLFGSRLHNRLKK